MRADFAPPEPIRDEQAIDVAMGRDDSLPRVQAINLLRTRERADAEKAELLAAVLDDSTLGPQAQHVAIMGLYEVNTPEAQRELLRLSQSMENPKTQATVAQVLGRIGDQEAFEPILEIRDRTEGYTQSQAAFSASLLSYRLNLPGHELPFPDEQELLRLSESDDAQTMDISPATDEEAALALRSLANESFGVEYDRETMYQIQCGQTTLMLLLNEAFDDESAAEKLRQQKALLGVIGIKSPEEDRYSTGFLILTSPKDANSDQIQLVVHRTKGEQAFAGHLTVDGSQLRASVRTVAQPGVPAIRFKATYENGELSVTEAASATTARPGRMPGRG
jgi:hypothetical protein